MDIKKNSLKGLVTQKQILAPCVWDTLSAGAAAAGGFEATVLSSASVALCMCGLPDIGILSMNDILYCAEGVARNTALPCCVDADDGYGEMPLNAYRTSLAIIETGASGQMLNDATGYRNSAPAARLRRAGVKDIDRPVLPMDKWLAKTKAALDAGAGKDFISIMRTEALYQYGIDEAIERCRRAAEIGAEMTMISGLLTQEEAEKVAKYVTGAKGWLDLEAHDGKADVEPNAIDALGYNFITTHIFEKHACLGIYDFAKHNLANWNTLYNDLHNMGLSDDDVEEGPYGRQAKKPAPVNRWSAVEPSFWQY